MNEQTKTDPATPTPAAWDIGWSRMPELHWNTDEEVRQSLDKIHQFIEDRAQKAYQWYMERKRTKASASRGLRFTAILLTVAGGLAPTLGPWLGKLTATQSPSGTEIGFLLLGLAAACVALDKFFGFSSGWMRYMTTAQAIQSQVSQLELDWMIALAAHRKGDLDSESIINLLVRAKTFLETVDGQISREMQAWIAEFQSNLSQLDNDVARGARDKSPGVTVDSNARNSEGANKQPLTGALPFNSSKTRVA